MEVTIKLVLRENKANKGGLCPIAVRVYTNGKIAYFTTGIRLLPDKWQGGQVNGKHPNSALLNQVINKKKNDIEALILKEQVSGRPLSIKRISTLVNKPEQDIQSFASGHIKYLSGKYEVGTIFNYNNEIKKLIAYAPGVTFEDVDIAFLKKYEQHLRDSGLSENSLHKNWKIIKAIFNAARAEKLTDNYPFSDYDNPKYRDPDKSYLTEEEIQLFESAMEKPMTEYMRRTGYYFLLSCYSGLRYSDWSRFKPSFIQGDKLVLRAKKNGQIVSMHIHNKLRKVLDIVVHISPDIANQNCNEYLKLIADIAGIKKNLTTHTGRHTFACLCASKGISKSVTAELMGITEKVCSVYYQLTGSLLKSEVEKLDS